MATGNQDTRIAELIGFLGDKERAMQRMEAVQALGRIGAAAIPALIHCLDDPRPRAKTDAAIALSMMGRGAAEAVPALTRMASDPNPAVAIGAKMALERIRG